MSVTSVRAESTIRSSPFVEAAIMFGDRRFHAGVIIVPSPTHSVNSKDIEEVKKYKDLVWWVESLPSGGDYIIECY